MVFTESSLLKAVVKSLGDLEKYGRVQTKGVPSTGWSSSTSGISSRSGGSYRLVVSVMTTM